MTPDHASPEQVRGQSITTASDVYVLGVLLYRLLAGVGPFVIGSVRLADIERAICETPPPLPSQAVPDGNSAQAHAISEARGTTVRRLRRALEGDLDNIVCMAMRKEPERRYGSAEQLAGDIRRHLQGKPVIARKDTLAYRSAKFVRRHWLPVGTGTVVFLLILAFAVTTDVQSARIAAERDRVAEQREAAEHERCARRGGVDVSGRPLQAVRSGGEPRQPGDRPRAVWTRAPSACANPSRINRRPRRLSWRRSAPSTRAWDSTRTPSRFCGSRWRCSRNRRTSRVSTRSWNWGRVLFEGGHLQEAEAPLQEALRLSQREFGATDLESGRVLWVLGQLRHLEGDAGGAIDLYKRALGILESDQGPPTEVARLLDDLAQDYARRQQWIPAKQTYERALAIDRDILGNDHPRVASHLHNLAIVAQNMGDLKRAESLYLEAIDSEERAFGDQHPETAAAQGNYALLLEREGRLAEAEPLLRNALTVALKVWGADNFNVGYARVSLAMALHDEGQLREAETQFRQALAIYDKSLPPNHPYRAAALMHLAQLLVDSGRAQEALPLSGQSIAIWAAGFPASHPPAAQAHAIHAYALSRLGHRAEAADELATAVPILKAARGADDPSVRRAEAWWAGVRASASPPTANAANLAAPAAAPVAAVQ